MRCKIYLNVLIERNSLYRDKIFFFFFKNHIIHSYLFLFIFLLLAEFKYKFTRMVRIMKSITLDTTHNFTQFVRYTLSWRKRQSENEALPVTILVTRQRTLDDTIDAIKIYGYFISIYSIKLFIYFILLYLYVIRNKFARVNFYISFFLFSR